jgi:GGDEF domain-containing protein
MENDREFSSYSHFSLGEAIGVALRQSLAEHHFAARHGGEEFSITLSEASLGLR